MNVIRVVSNCFVVFVMEDPGVVALGWYVACEILGSGCKRFSGQSLGLSCLSLSS